MSANFQGFRERVSPLLQNNQAHREITTRKAAPRATIRAPPSLLVDPSSSTSSMFGAKTSSQTIPRVRSWLSSVSPWKSYISVIISNLPRGQWGQLTHNSHIAKCHLRLEAGCSPWQKIEKKAHNCTIDIVQDKRPGKNSKLHSA